MDTKPYIDELKQQISEAHDFPFEMVTYAQADKVFHDYVALKYYGGEGNFGDDLYIITMHSANTYTVTVWGEFDYDESEYNPKYIYLCDRQFWALDDLLTMMAVENSYYPVNNIFWLVIHNNDALEFVLWNEPDFFSIRRETDGVRFQVDGINVTASVDDYSISIEASSGENTMSVNSFNCKHDEIVELLKSLVMTFTPISFHTETTNLFKLVDHE